MRNFKPKVCEKCSSEFTPRSSQDKWCEKCRTFICKNCKKKFTVRRVQAARNTKYCSRECLIKGRETKVNHTCKKCKKPFTSKSANSTLCPNCCTLTCETCGKKYIVQPKFLKSSKYCSKECRSKGDMIHIWRNEDLEYIRKNYPFEISMKELAEKYNTSTSAVGRIISKLNLPKCPIELRQKRVGDTQRIWTKDKIIKKIQSEYKKGNSINSSTFQNNFGSIHYCACKLFGNWQKAVEAAGYDYMEINLYSERVIWNKDLIIKKILELYFDGIDLKASNIRDNYSSLFNGARRCKEIKTWEKAISLAGLDYSDICGDKWGTKYIGKDNNTYMSITEGMVADRLFDLKNSGKIDGYKTQVKVVENRRWTCDFVFYKNSQETWLEVDGLEESRIDGDYNEYNEKIEHYKRNNYFYKVVNSYKDLKKIIK